MLALAGACVVLPTIGFLGLDMHRQLVLATLEKYLPNIQFEEEGVVEFVEDMREVVQGLRKRTALFAYQRLGGGMIPESIREKIDNLEREILSRFLLGSDFFSGPEPEGRKILYRRKEPVCDNPFAQFGM